MKKKMLEYIISAVLTVLAMIIGVMIVRFLSGYKDAELSNELAKSVQNTETIQKIDDSLYIWTDPETGVQYIVYSEKSYNKGMGGITPRINLDGSLYTGHLQSIQDLHPKQTEESY